MTSKSILAVDLGGTNLRVGRIEDNAITKTVVAPVPATDNEDVVLQALMKAIESIFDSNTAAIGIGVPSVVDVEKGIVYTVQNIPSWQEVHLKDKLQQKFQVPVHVNNDANCFALGEFHYGKARGFRHLVAMTIGTGLGSGIIIDRRLYNGSNCGAGEIGTIPYRDQTVEYYCSGQYFTRECGMSGEQVYAKAEAGDSAALKAYVDFGREMAHVLMIALYAFDPEIVLLGGSVSRAYRFFQGSMMDTVRSTFAYRHALDRLTIDCSELPEIALLGAAALHLDSLEK